MNIYYLGHSSFLIKTENGKRILTDPFKIDSALENVDIVTVSHPHFDHSDTDTFPDKSRILQTYLNYENNFCEIETFNSYHDNFLGTKRGSNLIFFFTIENITLCHLGDLGHILDTPIIEKIKNVDILFVPVGENYTINLKSLFKMINQLNPRYIIPMHYKTEDSNLSLNSLDKFLLIFKSYSKEKLDTLLISEELLLETRKKIIILDKTKVDA
ncbi:MAG: MBL fold metallo-hydrolase [Sarcina sp.]